VGLDTHCSTMTDREGEKLRRDPLYRQSWRNSRRVVDGTALGAPAAEPVPAGAALRSQEVKAPQPPLKDAIGCSRFFDASGSDAFNSTNDGCKPGSQGCYTCEHSQSGLIFTCYEAPTRAPGTVMRLSGS
jgi:hypothetical protein